MQRIFILLSGGACAGALVCLWARRKRRRTCRSRASTAAPRSAHGRQPALLGHLCLWRSEASVRLQLLSHQAWRRLSAVGYRPRHDGAQRRAEGEHGRPSGEARRQARADQICRHQPLSRRPHRPGRLVSEGDGADRQRRLGRDHEPDAGHRRELQAVRSLDQGREQGRTAHARQGCVRRRQRDRAAHARAHARPFAACWSSCRRRAPWC